MPPDSRADGPCGPKARRTRGPASPGQRTAQPFGGTLNASPLRCASGASVSRGRSAGLPQAAAHAGHRPHAGVRRPTRAAAHAGRRSSQAFRDPCGPPYTRGLGPPAGIPQASRRPPPRAGHRSLQAFRRPPAGRRHARDIGPSRAFRGPPYTRGLGLSRAFRGPRRPPHAGDIGPRRRSATHAGRRTRGASALAAHAALAGVSQAARARSQPAPAARFSRKPPCGIGSRMVYCT